MENHINFNPFGNRNISQGTLNKVPIKRNSMFYADADAQFDIRVGQEYLTADMNMSVVLYRIDLEKTNLDVTYFESGKHKPQFLPPIEISCVYEIKDENLKSYDSSKNLGTYQQIGQLEVNVYQVELDYKGVDIRKGDYIGVQIDEHTMAFFVVFNDGKINYSNQESLYGTRPFYRKIECASIDMNEFDGE